MAAEARASPHPHSIHFSPCKEQTHQSPSPCAVTHTLNRGGNIHSMHMIADQAWLFAANVRVSPEDPVGCLQGWDVSRGEWLSEDLSPRQQTYLTHQPTPGNTLPVKAKQTSFRQKSLWNMVWLRTTQPLGFWGAWLSTDLGKDWLFIPGSFSSILHTLKELGDAE